MNGAIIQARTGSTRLENKVLMSIHGKTMLERVISRVKMARTPELIIVATSIEERDDRIVDICQSLDIPCFRGSEQDVLDRFYQCATMLKMDPIIRITADCPLIDPDIIDQTVELFNIASWQYTLTYYHPDGLDVEVFSMEALTEAWKQATDPYQREHVTSYIRGHYLAGVVVQDDYRHYHWSVDTEEDLNFVRAVYGRLGDNFRFQDILNIVKGGFDGVQGGDETITKRVGAEFKRQRGRKRDR
jgi:spore coat polysaccharide biosynthesis protein SpsF